MPAPTEAEIRDVVLACLTEDGTLNAAGQLSDAFNEVNAVLDQLWNLNDFRDSEEEALNQAAYDAIDPICRRVLGECVEALTAAGLRFATEHPEAPRARVGARA